MSSPNVVYVELKVPDAKSEEEFLRLVVQAALKKYRATLSPIPPDSTCREGMPSPAQCTVERQMSPHME